jgi:hypothetical protein
MKARSGCSGFRSVLFFDVFLEYIKRNSTTGIHEVGTRPENRLTVKLVDVFSKLFANQPNIM